MKPPPLHDNEPEDTAHRRELFVGIFVVALVLFGIWLIDGFRQHIKLEECLEAGHRNCMPLDIDTQNGR